MAKKKTGKNPFDGMNFTKKEEKAEKELSSAISKISNAPSSEKENEATKEEITTAPEETKDLGAVNEDVINEETDKPEDKETDQSKDEKNIGEKNNMGNNNRSFDDFFQKKHDFSHSSNTTISKENLAKLKIICAMEDTPTSHVLDTIVDWFFETYETDIKKNGYDKLIKKKLKLL